MILECEITMALDQPHEALMRIPPPFLALLILGGYAMMARSDEGMWLLNDPPRELLKQKYGFDLTDAWVKRVMHASVRFNNGGSGGFVSADGLVVTNHHIAADALQKLSTPQRDLYRDGFTAATKAEELKCPDLELNVLQSIEDVTRAVNDAVKPDLPPALAFAARRAVLASIEKKSLDETKLRSDVVTLYNGGLYHLYRYKKYTDVRLVFAPEKAIAGFGGDVDNFEYPRYNLDVSFFRVYENGQPAKIEHFLTWSETGPKVNDLVFVTGHPGTTNRLETLAKLTHRRDQSHPYTLARLRAMEAALLQYGESSPEAHRQAATDHHRYANARKAFAGQYQGLLDASVMEQKNQQERSLFEKIPNSDAWKRVAEAQGVLSIIEKEHALLETGHAFATELFAIARHLVRLAEELPKNSSDRLREYRDSNLESLKFQLFSPAPIHADLERVKLTAALTFLAENLGGSHVQVQKVLAGQSPANQAAELIKGTKLADVAERKKLFDGGKAAIDASTDPMILLAKAIDAEARGLRKRYEEEVEEPERQAYARIANFRFKAFGKSIAPDATFTLRLAFGTVKGYEVDGKPLPPWTTFAGAFERSTENHNREPFDLPPRWLEGKVKLNLATPFNFVSTADTIGGNSGSPVLNRGGELVGVNFDRNRHGLVRNFVYTDVQARHIAVDSRAVIEAMRKLYQAGHLLKELTGRN